jgi:Mg2+ and Co2+ transporter CorA
MNFDILPELHWEWGYGWFYMLCALSVAVMSTFMYYLGLIGSR